MHGSVDEAGWGRHRESKNGQQRSPHLGGAQDEVRSTHCPGTGARSCDCAPWSVRSFGVVQAGFSSGLLSPPSPTRSQANSSLQQRLVRAGKVHFQVSNASVDSKHEMIVVKTPLTPDKFPTNADHSRVDEKKFKGAEEVSEIKPGDTGHLDTTLTPGHYVLFCNIKNRFKGGMYAELTVTR
jgi:uncharacterized cupredoxin-like copper-binding protein